MIKRLLFTCLLFLWIGMLRAQSPLELACNLEADNMLLSDCLFQLMDNHFAPLSFQSSIIPEKRVKLVFRQEKLSIILSALLQETNLKYQLVGDQIVLVEKPRPSEKPTHIKPLSYAPM